MKYSTSPIKYAPSAGDSSNREAIYLYETGQISEARQLLESAISAANEDLDAMEYIQSYYALKLMGALAILEGFVGYDERAIELTKQEYAYAETWSSRPNLIRIRINLLANIVDYQGADDSSIEEADALLAEYTAAGYQALGSMQRLHTRILVGKKSTEDHIKQLIEAARIGHAEESAIDQFYSERNSLFLRAERNEPHLDQAFHQFLLRSREQGNLRAEPRIYRRYGNWLQLQTRYSEAIQMYQIALTRSILFDLHPTVLLLHAKLASAYIRSGQESQAKKTMQAMESYYQTQKDKRALT